jgi:hypothetical protein
VPFFTFLLFLARLETPTLGYYKVFALSTLP